MYLKTSVLYKKTSKQTGETCTINIRIKNQNSCRVRMISHHLQSTDIYAIISGNVVCATFARMDRSVYVYNEAMHEA